MKHIDNSIIKTKHTDMFAIFSLRQEDLLLKNILHFEFRYNLFCINSELSMMYYLYSKEKRIIDAIPDFLLVFKNNMYNAYESDKCLDV